jgi:hypothetical protein
MKNLTGLGEALGFPLPKVGESDTLGEDNPRRGERTRRRATTIE